MTRYLTPQFYNASGAFNLFLMVLLGAVGTHTLKGSLNTEQMQFWQTATQYHAIHALGLFVIANFIQKHPGLASFYQKIGLFLWAGILLFSGGLYLFALGIYEVHVIIPFGGLSWLIAWGMLFLISVKPETFARDGCSAKNG